MATPILTHEPEAIAANQRTEAAYNQYNAIAQQLAALVGTNNGADLSNGHPQFAEFTKLVYAKEQAYRQWQRAAYRYGSLVTGIR